MCEIFSIFAVLPGREYLHCYATSAWKQSVYFKMQLCLLNQELLHYVPEQSSRLHKATHGSLIDSSVSWSWPHLFTLTLNNLSPFSGSTHCLKLISSRECPGNRSHFAWTPIAQTGNEYTSTHTHTDTQTHWQTEGEALLKWPWNLPIPSQSPSHTLLTLTVDVAMESDIRIQQQTRWTPVSSPGGHYSELMKYTVHHFHCKAVSTWKCSHTMKTVNTQMSMA